MMYVDEDEVWKCPLHPTRRRRSGVCSTCLKERLNSLCPDCANLRPCGCPCAASSNSSSSSSSNSSSFARFFSSSGDASVGRVSNLTEAEPSMRRSRSVAVSSLFRSRSRFVRDIVGGEKTEESSSSSAAKGSKRTAFLGIFKRDTSKRSGVGSGEATLCGEDDGKRASEQREPADMSVDARMMRKSRSVAVMSNPFGGDVRSAGRSSRGWHFPSPMKAFKQSKVSKAESTAV